MILFAFSFRIFDKAEGYLSKKWRRTARAYIDAGFHPETHFKCAKFTCEVYKPSEKTSTNSRKQFPAQSLNEAIPKSKRSKN